MECLSKRWSSVSFALALSAVSIAFSGSACAPPKTADTWRGLNALRDDEVYEWTVQGGASPGFGTPRHVRLVQVAARCSDELATAQWRQDTALQFDATAHFDNCTFKGTLDYIASLLAQVDRRAGQAAPSEGDVTEAMSLLGRALHAIQDFYAHSNYVELMAAKNAPFGEDLVLPVWTPAGAQDVLDLAQNGGLVSGRVWWDSPKMCASTVQTHAELAKDDEGTPSGKVVLPNWNRTGYRAAYQLAGWATLQFLHDMYAHWPALQRFCGPTVDYLAPADHRPDVP